MGGNVSRQVAWNWLESAMVRLAKVVKSRARIARSIASMRSGTMAEARWARRRDVLTDSDIPEVDGVSFCASDTTAMSTFISGQWEAGATHRPSESDPSSFVPMSHATHPPNTLRHAEPEPARAYPDTCSGVKVRAFGRANCASNFSTARVHETASAARPAADEARPAAVGKLLREYTMKRTGEPSTGAGRMDSKIRCMRLDTWSTLPLSTNESPV
mmetsp:Transcript_13499/g.42496  ORF Transcript_13499/g.42496 Transcript_13499/m.42496 type:complete len:216 (+) Transcript_13499:375-1022(+)